MVYDLLTSPVLSQSPTSRFLYEPELRLPTANAVNSAVDVTVANNKSMFSDIRPPLTTVDEPLTFRCSITKFTRLQNIPVGIPNHCGIRLTVASDSQSSYVLPSEGNHSRVQHERTNRTPSEYVNADAHSQQFGRSVIETDLLNSIV